MAVTNYASQAIAWQLGSDIPNNYIQYFAIGSGSGTSSVNNTVLVAEVGSRMVITNGPNYSTARKVTFQGDFNSVQMSGIQLTEFGLFASGASQTGSTWQREAFSSITFDGTNELQIVTTLEVSSG